MMKLPAAGGSEAEVMNFDRANGMQRTNAKSSRSELRNQRHDELIIEIEIDEQLFRSLICAHNPSVDGSLRFGSQSLAQYWFPLHRERKQLLPQFTIRQ